MLKKYFYISWLITLVTLLLVSNLKITAKISEKNITESDLIEIKQKLLNLINENRKSLGLNSLALDELASKVGERHCQEMLTEGYFSHWNTKGLKPYIRYSYAGGRDALIENLSSSQGGVHYNNPERLTNMLMQMHFSMFNENPPNDGHRQAIVYPQNTHVGLGIAFDEGQVRLAEEFISRYVDVKQVPAQTKAGNDINIAGRILNPKECELVGISVFYEPTPQILTIEDLNSRGSYSLPDTEVVLKPKVYNGIMYADGSTGEIEYKKSVGSFSCLVGFPKDRPGIYTIVVWLKREKEKFIATNISIEAR